MGVGVGVEDGSAQALFVEQLVRIFIGEYCKVLGRTHI